MEQNKLPSKLVSMLLAGTITAGMLPPPIYSKAADTVQLSNTTTTDPATVGSADPRTSTGTQVLDTDKPQVSLNGFTVVKENVDYGTGPTAVSGNKVFQFNDVTVQEATTGIRANQRISLLTIYVEDGVVYGDVPTKDDLPGGKWERINDLTKTTYTYYYNSTEANTTTPANIATIIKSFQFQSTNPHVDPKITVIVDAGEIRLDRNIASLTYSPENGHYYAYYIGNSTTPCKVLEASDVPSDLDPANTRFTLGMTCETEYWGGPIKITRVGTQRSPVAAPSSQWVNAYNSAKQQRFMGMTGYLATLTSLEESALLTKISQNGAWSGGTRTLKRDDAGGVRWRFIADDDSVGAVGGGNGDISSDFTGGAAGQLRNKMFVPLFSSGAWRMTGEYHNYTNQWYWACGPEAATQGSVFTLDSLKGGASLYNNSNFQNQAGQSPVYLDAGTYRTARTTDIAQAKKDAGNLDAKTTESEFYDSNVLIPTVNVNVAPDDPDRIIPWPWQNVAPNDMTHIDNEPNNGNNKQEWFMQVNYQAPGTSKREWNDAKHDDPGVKGYFVEFGGYPDDMQYASTTTATVDIYRTIYDLDGGTFANDSTSGTLTQVLDGGYTVVADENGTAIPDAPSGAGQQVAPRYFARTTKWGEVVGTMKSADGTTPFIPTKTEGGINYIFGGWEYSGNLQAADATYGSLPKTDNASVKRNVLSATLKAKWLKPETLTLTMSAPAGYDLSEISSITAAKPTLPGGESNVPGLGNNQVTNHGSGTLTTSVLGTATITLPAAPTLTKQGGSSGSSTAPVEYEFAGWEFQGKTYQPGATVEMGEGSTEIKALWKKVRYNLTYNANGGMIDGEATKTESRRGVSTDTQSADNIDVTNVVPTRAGYTFAGWTGYNNTTYGGSEGTNNPSFTMPEQDLTLTAKWTAKTYAINFELGDGVTGSVAGGNTINYDYDSNTFTVPGAGSLKRGEDIFLGWSTTPPNHMGEDGQPVKQTVDVAVGGSATDKMKELMVAESNNTGGIKLYPVWSTAADTKLIFNGNGGTIDGSPSKTVPGYPDSDASGAIPTASQMTRFGYEFLGWDTDPNTTNPADIDFPANGTPTSGTTLKYPLNTVGVQVYYAIWGTSSSMKVIYDTDEHGNRDSLPPIKNDAVMGQPMTAVDQNTLRSNKVNYEFANWEVYYTNQEVDENNINGVTWNLLTVTSNLSTVTVNGNMKAKAIFRKMSTVPVYFFANGGIITSTSASNQKLAAEVGTTQDLPAVTRAGYTLAGWDSDNTQNYASIDITSANTPTKTTTAIKKGMAANYTARWAAKTYTINYHLEGEGLSSSSVTSIQSHNYVYDSTTGNKVSDGEKDLQTGLPKVTKQSKKLVGWSLNPVSDARTVDVNLGAEVNATLKEAMTKTADTNSITLYPVWVDNANTTITFFANGGTITKGGNASQLMSGQGGSQVQGIIPTPVRDGYNFVGWATTSTATKDDVLPQDHDWRYPDAGYTSYYAVWEAKNYTFQFTFSAADYPDGLTIEDGGSTITVGQGGGQSSQASKEVTYTYDGDFTLPGNASSDSSSTGITLKRAGYRLAGWAITAGGSSVVGADETEISPTLKQQLAEMIGGNGTFPLYPVWQKLAETTIAFHPNSGKIKTWQAPASDDQQGSWGDTMSKDPQEVIGLAETTHRVVPGVDDMQRTGYTFAGWSTDPNADAPDSNPDMIFPDAGTKMYYAVWTPKQYAVKYEGNGATENVPETKLYTYDDITFTLASQGNMKRGEDIFLGWTTAEVQDENAPHVTDAAESPVSNVLKDAMVANENADKITVPNEQGEYPYITLYAVWKKATPTRVLFDANGGDILEVTTLSSDPVKSATKLYSGSPRTGVETERVPVDSTANPTATVRIERTGYTFKGWSTDPNATWENMNGVVSDGSFMYPDGNTAVTTYYAVWKPHQYEIRYDLGTNAKAGGATGKIDPLHYTYGTEGAVSDNKFTQDQKDQGYGFAYPGHYLAGWALKDNSTEVLTALGGDIGRQIRTQLESLKQQIGNQTGQTSPGGNSGTSPQQITLYAVWRENGRTAVQFSPNGGQIGGQSEATVFEGLAGAPFTATIPANETLTRDGYTFAGWYQDVSGTQSATLTGISFPTAGTTTFYAKWTPKKYKVKYDGNVSDSFPVVGVPTNATEYTYDTDATVAEASNMKHNEDIFRGWSFAPLAFDPHGKPIKQVDIAAGASFSTALKQKLVESEQRRPADLDPSFAGEVTLYAVWDDPSETRIILNANQGSITNNQGTVVQTLEFHGEPNSAFSGDNLPAQADSRNFEVQLDTITRDGYTLVGWSENENAVYNPGADNPDIIELSKPDELSALTYPASATGVTIYYAIWQAEKYKIDYVNYVNADDPSDPLNATGAVGKLNSQLYTYESETDNTVSDGNAPADDSTQTTFKRPGYYLAGWATPSSDPNKKGKPETDERGNVVIAIAPGGEIGSEVRKNLIKLKKLLAATITDEQLEQLQRAGLSGQITLYAVWLPNNDTSIQFLPNGGQIDSKTDAKTVAGKAASFLQKDDIPTAAQMSRDGYTFAGWYDEIDKTTGKQLTTKVDEVTGEEITIEGDATTGKRVTFPNGGTTSYYAIWEPKRYKINYNGSSEGKTVENVPDTEVYTYDGETVANEGKKNGQDIKRNEDIFLGWSLTAPGAVDENNDPIAQTVDIAAGAGFNTKVKKALRDSETERSDGFAGEITLYAVWSDSLSTRIMFNANQGTFAQDVVLDAANGGTIVQTYGEPNTEVANSKIPTEDKIDRLGYTFLGWSTDDSLAADLRLTTTAQMIEKLKADAQTKQVTFIAKDEIATKQLQYPAGTEGVRIYYAIWKPDRYQITYNIAKEDVGALGTIASQLYTFNSNTNNTVSNAKIPGANGKDEDALTYAGYNLVGWRLPTTRPGDNGEYPVDIVLGGEINSQIRSKLLQLKELLGQSIPDDQKAALAQQGLSGVVPLYAVWRQNGMTTIQFELNGGMVTDNTSIVVTGPAGSRMDNSKRPADTSVTRDGYTFAGWYDNLENGKKLDDNSEVKFPAGAITSYYAHWTPKKYKIVYNGVDDTQANTTTEGVPQAQDYTYDSDAAVSEGTGMKRNEDQFLGWSIGQNDGTVEISGGSGITAALKAALVASETGYQPAQGDESKGYAGEVTLYAVWKKPTNTRIIFNGNQGSIYQLKEIVQPSETTGPELNDDTAEWRPVHQIQGEPNVAAGSAVPGADRMSRGGYVFLGWSTEENFSAERAQTLLDISIADRKNQPDAAKFIGKDDKEALAALEYPAGTEGVKIYYAVWRAKSYRIKFNLGVEEMANGATGVLNDQLYTFDSLTGGIISDGTVNAAKGTVKVVKKENATDNSSTTTIREDEIIKTLGENETIAGESDFTYPSYKLIGWSIKDNYQQGDMLFSLGGEIGVQARALMGSQISSAVDTYDIQRLADGTIIDGIMPLYAVWSSNDETSIQFVANGGRFVTEDGTLSADNVVRAASAGATLSTDQIPTAIQRDGYTFKNWYKDISENADLMDKNNTIFPVGGTDTYYAHWTPKTYTVHYDSNSEISATIGDLSYTYDVETQVDAGTAFRRDGYTLAGWAFSKANADAGKVDVGLGESVSYAMKAQLVADEAQNGNTTSTTLYAVWNAGSVTVRFDTQGGSYVAPRTAIAGTADTRLPDAPTKAGYTFLGWSRGANDTNTLGESIAWPAVETTLYAQWQVNTYPIVYDKNHSEATGTLTEQSFRYDDDTFKVRDNKTEGTMAREGYTLMGWALQANSQTADIPLGETMNVILRNAIGAQTDGTPITLYAVWQLNGTSTVSFVANGGTIEVGGRTYSSAYTLTDNQGRTIAPALLPVSDKVTRQGYTFAGWSTDPADSAEGSELPSGLKYPDVGQAGAVTYYAKWTPNQYTITYDGNAGSKTVTGVPAVMQYTYDDETFQLSDGSGMTRNEDIFLGWSFTKQGAEQGKVDAEGGNGVTTTLQNQLTQSPDRAITLYAVWSNAAESRILFNGNSGLIDGQSTVQISGEPNVKVAQIPNQPTRAGYTFLGWSRDSDATTPDLAKDSAALGDIAYPSGTEGVRVYYAVWQANTYTIRYDGNGGQNTPTAISYTFDSAQLLSDGSGMTHGVDSFLGWTTQKPSDTYTAIVDTIPGSLVTPTLKDMLLHSSDGSITLYAVWQKAADTKIHFNGNGSTLTLGQNQGNVLTISGTPNTAIGSDNVPMVNERAGYTFLGWSKDSAATVPDDGLTISGTTQYPDPSVSVDTYYAVWALNTNVTVSLEANYEGAPAIAALTGNSLGTTLTPDIPVRPGYSFLGWNVDPQATSGNMNITVPANDITYYAIWSVNDVTLTFNAEGGTSVKSMTGKAQEALTTETPTRYGYDFGGWYTERNGQGERIGETFPTASTTYYAHWTLHKYTVKFVDVDPTDPTGNTKTEIGEPQLVEYTKAATAPAEPSRAGYVFVGWNTHFLSVTSDLEIAAVYREESSDAFTVRFVDSDGTLLKTQTVARGGTATPPKMEDSDSAIFTGWDQDLTNVQKSMTVVAQYSSTEAAEGQMVRVVFYGSTSGSTERVVVETRTVVSGGLVGTLPTVPARTGYTTDGKWYTDQNYTTEVVQSRRITGTSRFYAKYEPMQLKLSFEDKNGSLITGDKVQTTSEYGQTVTYPDNASTNPGAGEMLGGWTEQLDAETGELKYVPVFVPKADPNRTSVSFTGADGQPMGQTVAVGADGKLQGTLPTVPQKPGYTTDGNWYYTDPTTGERTRFDPQTDVLGEDTNLYPVYEPTHTVDFYDKDGNPIGDTQNVTGGNRPNDPYGDNAPAEEGKTFVGWQEEIDPVTGAVSYKPVYVENGDGQIFETFVVTFKDDTGKVFSVQNVVAGQGAVEPYNPNKQGYDFKGWDKAFDKITEPTTITGIYEINKYKVTFLNAQDQVLTVQTVEYGGSATAPAAPEKQGYLFAGWNTSLDRITSDVTVSPVYVEQEISAKAYNIVFYGSTGTSADDVVIGVWNIAEGRTINEDDIPVAPARIGYLVDGTMSEDGRMYTTWYTDPAFTQKADLSQPITGDYKLYAKYMQYTATFVDADGNEIKSEQSAPNQMAGYPMLTDDQIPAGKTLAGWKEQVDLENGTITYVPDFVDAPSSGLYMVSFVGSSESVAPQIVQAGATLDELPAIGALKGSEAQGWYYVDETGTETAFDAQTPVTRNLVLYARYRARPYEVVYATPSGEMIGDTGSQTVDTDGKPTNPSAASVPEEEGKLFAGWEELVNPANGDVVYVAKYIDLEAPDATYYTVIFQDWDGTVLKTESVRQGKSVGLPSAPRREGYQFVQWNGNTKNIEQNEFVTAVYRKNQAEFVVTFLGRSGEVISEQKVTRGQAAQAPAVPSESGWVFKGWDTDYSNIQGITVVKAQYVPEDTEDEVTLTFYNWNGVVLNSIRVPKAATIADKTTDGKQISAEVEQTKQLAEKYNASFSDWDGIQKLMTSAGATNSLDIIAQFDANTHYVEFKTDAYTSFVNENDRKQKQAVLSGESLPAVPQISTKSGYQFIGWMDSNTKDVLYTDTALLTVAVESNVTYVPYVVRLGGNGGSSGLPFYTPVESPSETVAVQEKPVTFGVGDLQLNTTEHIAYINGREDGNVYPEHKITRAEIASIFYRLLTDESKKIYESTDVSGLTDVSGSEWYATAVATMSKAGVITGYTDGSFRANSYVTRAELATMIARMSGVQEYVGKNLFDDAANHWAKTFINAAGDKGWLKGYENGEFRPDQTITRGEAITVINRILGRDKVSPESFEDADTKTWNDSKLGSWYYEAIQEATHSHTYTRDESGYEQWG